jgi:hypothetical protein
MEAQKKGSFSDLLVELLENTALGLIGLFHEHGQSPCRQRPFHDQRHTLRVIARAETIFEAIQKSAPGCVQPRFIRLVRIAAAYHDIVQRGVSGMNERLSYECVKALWSMLGQISGQALDDGDLQLIEEAIMATMTNFDESLLTAVQPNLQPNSHPIARCVALADLGTAGMDGPTCFIEDGNRLFHELNPYVMDALRSLRPNETISESYRTRFTRQIIIWSDNQPGFAANRRARLNTELEGLPPEAATAVRSLFCEFDNSIMAASRVAETRRSMNFEQLIADLGFRSE